VTPDPMAAPQGMAALLHFLSMGGHALYVWLSYGAGLLVVVYHVWSTRRREQDWIRQARAQVQRRSGGGAGVAPHARDDQAEIEHRQS
jgi:heme exporter protein CcmD